MKILAFTDHHGSPNDMKQVEHKSTKVDLIICGGDFTIFEHEVEYIMDQISRLPKKVLLIHGNHESEEVIHILSEQLDNIEFIHKKVVEIDNYVIVGYGGGGFSSQDLKFEEFIKKLKIDKNKKMILLLHGPPYGTKLDRIGGEYVGNKSFTKVIKEIQPDLVLCGHLHENFWKDDKIGKSKIINPGPDGRIIKI